MQQAAVVLFILGQERLIQVEVVIVIEQDLEHRCPAQFLWYAAHQLADFRDGPVLLLQEFLIFPGKVSVQPVLDKHLPAAEVILLVSQISSDTDITSILSAISFVVALLGVVGFPEVCKSFSYQMWELEQSCKYNLRQIVAIKLSIIGMIDLIIILAITLFTSLQTELPVWEMALYLFVPFNSACIVSFFITSLARNKNSVSPIFPAGFGFAFLMLLCINRFSPYQSISIPIWLILCFGTFAILIWKAAQFIKGMDEGGLAICN